MARERKKKVRKKKSRKQKPSRRPRQEKPPERRIKLMGRVAPVRLELARRALRRVQRYKPWPDFFLGRCGPAAVAMNEVLFNRRAIYVVLVDRPSDQKLPDRWRGHVALSYGPTLFDYEGELGWHQFACWPGRPSVGQEFADAFPTVLVGVAEDEVVRRFVDPCGAGEDWVARARDCLERALSHERRARRQAL